MWLASTFHRYFLINTEILVTCDLSKEDAEKFVYHTYQTQSLYCMPLETYFSLLYSLQMWSFSKNLILKIHQLHQFFSLHLSLSFFFKVTLTLSNDIKTVHADSVWDVTLGSKTILLLFSHSVVSHSLWPHELQPTRLPCPWPSPGVCSDSCLLSQWCHPTISSSVAPFSCSQSFSASGSFPVSQLFASGDWSIGASASASVFPMNIQGWFPFGLTGLISWQSKGLSRGF